MAGKLAHLHETAYVSLFFLFIRAYYMFFCPFFFILQHKLVAEDAMSSFSAGVLHFHSIYSISLCRVVAHTSSTHVPSV